MKPRLVLVIVIVCYFMLGASLFARERIFMATPFFQPIGDELEEIPSIGYAVVIEFAEIVDDLLRERTLHYYNGRVQSHWYFFYLADGRLHKKVQIDTKNVQAYEEQYFYRTNKQLWLVLSSQRTHIFERERTLWQENGVMDKIAVNGANWVVDTKIRTSPTTFVLDPELEHQVEEVWLNGRLMEMRFYSYGILQRTRHMQTKNNFEEILYYEEQPIVKRFVQDGKVISQESIDIAPEVRENLP